MAVLGTIKLAGVVALVGGAQATTFLAPAQDIVLPKSDSASEPLQWLGANSPYFAGPDVHHISNAVPEGCTVEQVAYNVRHGSRFPDKGAYNQWTALYAKIQAANFTATGSMAFLKDWKPVLTNPTLEIAQESVTGFKESFDLGYQLRTRYPKLYAYGTPFISWANLYPRVVQTAQNFVRGFLGSTASTLGQVITVSSTGSEQALFDSLSPSDLCPNFVDGNGGTEQTTWNNIYLPPILARLDALIDGHLAFTTSDVSIFPYLCGFESQITGTLSPWCSVFTDEELKQYEFSQDLRYYYGTGPGVDLASKMMLPYLESLVGILSHGPGVNGTFANGTTYALPNIITAFMNDGQITELGAATGVWENTISLGDGTSIPDRYKYIASHFVSMRGTVAFERLNCVAPATSFKAKRDEEEIVTITQRKTVTICTETESSTAPAVIITKVPEMTTSTVWKTSVYTISSCPPTITNCPIGQITSTIYASTTVCPVEEASTTAAPAAEWTTSTVIKTSSYIVTSCKHDDKHCTVGEMTSTIYSTTTVCPVEASTTSASSSWATSTYVSTSTGKVTSCASNDESCTIGEKTSTVITSMTSHVVSASANATPTGSSSSSSSFVTKSSSGLGYSSIFDSGSASGSTSGSSKTSASSSGSASITASVSYTSGLSNSTTTSSASISHSSGHSNSITSSTYLNATATHPFSNSTASSTTSATATATSSGNHTYIRIMLNDAVYPVPSCKDGPGSSCLMSEYVNLIKAKVAAAGDLVTRCNVTAAGAPTKVKGASFFTDLSGSWLASVVP